MSNQKPTVYIKGDKVVIAPEAKTPMTTPERHFTRGELMTNWTVDSRNGFTLIIKDDNSIGKLTVKDTDVVYMPTNDIGFMDSVVIKLSVTN